MEEQYGGCLKEGIVKPVLRREGIIFNIHASLYAYVCVCVSVCLYVHFQNYI